METVGDCKTHNACACIMAELERLEAENANLRLRTPLPESAPKVTQYGPSEPEKTSK